MKWINGRDEHKDLFASDEKFSGYSQWWYGGSAMDGVGVRYGEQDKWEIFYIGDWEPAPSVTTLEEAKALCIVMHRMGG